MNIRTEQRAGYATCARPRHEYGKCAGYNSRPIRVEVETVEHLYGDQGPSNDPFDVAMARNVERSFQYLRAVDDADNQCHVCGGPVSISLEPRPRYPRMSQQDPDHLIEVLAQGEERAEREERALELHERSASAQERLAEQTSAREQQMQALREREVAAQERANELEAIRLGLNGHDAPPRPSDVKPRPPRRRSAA